VTVIAQHVSLQTCAYAKHVNTNLALGIHFPLLAIALFLLQGSQLGTLAGQPAAKQSRRLGHWTMNRKLVLVMVGLPARGKSYIVKMLIRYLSWIGEHPAKHLHYT
jgi:6-phosphofructo-2-kinase